MTTVLIELPSGAYAELAYSFDLGDVVIAILLVALLLMSVLRSWRERPR